MREMEETRSLLVPSFTCSLSFSWEEVETQKPDIQTKEMVTKYSQMIVVSNKFINCTVLNMAPRQVRKEELLVVVVRYLSSSLACQFGWLVGTGCEK